MKSPKHREHVMNWQNEGVVTTYILHYMHMCVCACTCASVRYALSVWETGNYLHFAEKADLPLTRLLKLQYAAGAAYKKVRSTFCACMCVCVLCWRWGGGGCWGKALLCVCVFVWEPIWVFCDYADVSTNLWFSLWRRKAIGVLTWKESSSAMYLLLVLYCSLHQCSWAELIGNVSGRGSIVIWWIGCTSTSMLSKHKVYYTVRKKLESKKDTKPVQFPLVLKSGEKRKNL